MTETPPSGAAEALLAIYRQESLRGDSELSVCVFEDAANPRITEILRWLNPYGCDNDHALICYAQRERCWRM